MSSPPRLVVYPGPGREADAFARMLESLIWFTDHEPVETFADDVVVAVGAELSRRFTKRVREAGGGR